MNILVDCRSLGVRPSGVGIYTYEMIKLLNEYVDVNINVITDISSSTEMENLKKIGITVHEYGKKVKKNLDVFLYFIYIKKCIKLTNPDIFWEPNIIIPINLRRKNLKIVATIHDIFPVTYPEYYSKLYNLYFRYGIKKTLSQVDGYAYISKTTQTDILNKYQVAKSIYSKLVYIPIMCNNNENNINNNDFLYVGNMERRKGIDILLDAYQLYRDSGGNKGLRLAGKISERSIEEKIYAMVSKYDNIKYLGYVSEERKYKELAECFAFLFPSRAEGFGIPIIEAMHYYKPIISENLDVFRELVGNSLYFVDTQNKGNKSKKYADAMLEVEKKSYIDKDMYNSVIDRYLPQNIKPDIYDLFKKVVDGQED